MFAKNNKIRKQLTYDVLSYYDKNMCDFINEQLPLIFRKLADEKKFVFCDISSNILLSILKLLAPRTYSEFTGKKLLGVLKF